mmetsp:Transcript_2147/g.3780  ORF Transcript_2147/g.3780 Transcript_2147/m.3780 type:complete len:106 (+) Transcript_2147:686-1003(+)
MSSVNAINGSFLSVLMLYSLHGIQTTCISIHMTKHILFQVTATSHKLSSSSSINAPLIYVDDEMSTLRDVPPIRCMELFVQDLMKTVEFEHKHRHPMLHFSFLSL